jgi:hypothetical protein
MVRLTRKPSLWLGFLGRLVFCVIWAGGFAAFSWFIWTYHRHDTAKFVFFILGFFDLLALGMIWDIVVRFWRTLTNKQPELNIDHDNLRPGSTAQIQFTEPHPESLAEINVHFVGEHTVKQKSGTTTTIFNERCFDQELLQMNVDGPNPITRSLQIKVPAESPGNEVRWMILVNTRLRQGGIMQHSYPIQVK